MKRIFVKIFVILISFSILNCNVYATTEENNPQNKAEQESVAEEVKEEITEVKKNETMYVQERCNIRKGYSVDSERVGGLDIGTEVNVISEYSNGWYKIQYDGGKEAYIKAAILRSTKPEIPVEEPETENNTNEEPIENQLEKTPEVIENVQEEQPVVEETTEKQNADDETVNEDEILLNEIGVLPEVGKNIADYFYYGVVISSIAMVVYWNLERRK